MPDYHAFISYSSPDLAIAETIYSDLAAANMNVWFDKKIMHAGQRIRSEIDAGIRNSSWLLIIVSTYSLKSQWVLNELDAAMMREVAESKAIVIPILVGDVTPEQMPSDIQGKRYVDLRGDFKVQYAAARVELISAIINLLGGVVVDGYEFLPFGEPAMSRILSYNYVFSYHSHDVLKQAIDILVEATSV